VEAAPSSTVFDLSEKLVMADAVSLFRLSRVHDGTSA